MELIRNLWKQFWRPSIVMKGATCYELQIKRFGVRYCFLKGKYWQFKPWRRLSFQWFSPEQCADFAE
jgi:hypothetical protein